MSMYNLMFGQNPLSDAILATLGLTRADCGRFRDCFVTNGEIAVYTRNGGGNRNCWCEDNPKCGRQACKHHIITEEVDERIYVEKEEADQYPVKYNAYMGSKRLVGTGKQVIQDYYICENPNSADCACPGCVIEYRLPKHPCYLRDRDDEFDCTYATIYFKFSDEHAEELRKLDSGERFDPSQRWLDAIDALKKI